MPSLRPRLRRSSPITAILCLSVMWVGFAGGPVYSEERSEERPGNRSEEHPKDQSEDRAREHAKKQAEEMVLIHMPFKRGDTAIVATDAAAFYSHDKKLIRRLPIGTEVDVARTAIAWVGGYVQIDGIRRLGWIRVGYLDPRPLEFGNPSPRAPAK